MGIRKWIKKNKNIYNIMLHTYLFIRKVRVIPEYLRADSIKMVKSKKESNDCYLILEYSGKSGLMTQMIIVVGWLKYAVENNYILVVDMCSGENMYQQDDENAWEKFFIQPMCDFSVTKQELERIKSEENYAICPKKLKHNYQFESLFSLACRLKNPAITFPMPRDFLIRSNLHCVFQNVFKRYIRFQPEVASYMQTEYEKILQNKGRVLGVLARGTDYVQSKPYNHPVQPSVDEIIDKCEEIIDKWDYIYLATEEYAIEKKFREKFGDLILVNQRQYYDGDYQNKWLCDTRFDRENDEFFRGLEYVSSINILSKCNHLVAGLCGGTQAALIMNDNQYDYVYLFDLGNY